MIERPLGVWVLTIYAGVVKGLFTLVAILWLWFGSGLSAAELMPGLAFMGELAMVVSTIVLAFLTWNGGNRARILFISLLSLAYLLTAYNYYQGLSMPGLPDELRNAGITELLKGATYLGINIWYFTRSQTLRFYQSGDEYVKDGG